METGIALGTETLKVGAPRRPPLVLVIHTYTNDGEDYDLQHRSSR